MGAPWSYIGATHGLQGCDGGVPVYLHSIENDAYSRPVFSLPCFEAARSRSAPHPTLPCCDLGLSERVSMRGWYLEFLLRYAPGSRSSPDASSSGWTAIAHTLT